MRCLGDNHGQKDGGRLMGGVTSLMRAMSPKWERLCVDQARPTSHRWHPYDVDTEVC